MLSLVSHYMQIDVHWFPRFCLNIEDFGITVALMGYVVIVYYLPHNVLGGNVTVVYTDRDMGMLDGPVSHNCTL